MPFSSSLCKMTPNTEIMPNVKMLMSELSIRIILGMNGSRNGIGNSDRNPTAVDGIDVIIKISKMNAMGVSTCFLMSFTDNCKPEKIETPGS